MFRVTQEQLEAMHGIVRCGFCYSTFNALESLINEAITETPVIKEEESVIEDNIFNPPQTPSEIDNESIFPSHPEYRDHFIEDSAQKTDLESLADPFQQWREPSTEISTRQETQPRNEKLKTTKNESVKLPKRKRPITNVDDYIKELDQVLIPNYSDEKPNNPETRFASITKNFTKNKPSTSKANLDLTNTDIAEGLGIGLSKTGWQFSNFAWVLAILFLLGLILAQYTYFMRNDLAKYPAVRPWLEKLCDIAGCKIPLAKDATKISLVSRDIRTHPKEKGALLVKATIVNDAPFTQPFPELKLVLTDINNRVVATRQFEPKEYLSSGSINIDAGMNSKTHYDFQLEMVDPDKNAVGFEFHFL